MNWLVAKYILKTYCDEFFIFFLDECQIRTDPKSRVPIVSRDWNHPTRPYK